MIVVRLFGGLGNQLFQYAFGRALSVRLGTDLALDWGGFRWRDARRRALNPFSLKTVPVTSAVLPLKYRSRFQRWVFVAKEPLRLVRENSFQFDPTFLDLPDGVYVEGYFQSERYFKEIADSIRADLAVPEPRDARSETTIEEIRSTSAVSLHVRRGDYVTHARTNSLMGTSSSEYYEMAAEHVASAIGATPTFFVFSDDIDWAVANMRLPYPIHFVVGGDTRHPHADLWLMSQCRHHIIANSTFSWWGAWLNPSPTKVVVAPKVWFAGADMGETTLIPETWTRL